MYVWMIGWVDAPKFFGRGESDLFANFTVRPMAFHGLDASPAAFHTIKYAKPNRAK